MAHGRQRSLSHQHPHRRANHIFRAVVSEAAALSKSSVTASRREDRCLGRGTRLSAISFTSSATSQPSDVMGPQLLALQNEHHGQTRRAPRACFTSATTRQPHHPSPRPLRVPPPISSRCVGVRGRHINNLWSNNRIITEHCVEVAAFLAPLFVCGASTMRRSWHQTHPRPCQQCPKYTLKRRVPQSTGPPNGSARRVGACQTRCSSLSTWRSFSSKHKQRAGALLEATFKKSVRNSSVVPSARRLENRMTMLNEELLVGHFRKQ